MTTAGNEAAQWATGAGNKFREVARMTENPTTKLLAEGLAQLADGGAGAGRSVTMKRVLTPPRHGRLPLDVQAPG